MNGVEWVLLLTLWNFEHGPVSVDPETCLRVQGRVAAGMWVVVDRDDGTSTLVRRARCIRRKLTS